jgi:fumarylacetoacetase
MSEWLETMTEPWVHGDTWEPDDGRGLDALPYGIFVTEENATPRVGVAVGDRVLDLSAAAPYVLPQRAAVLAGPTLDPLLAAGRSVWHEVRDAVREALAQERHRAAVEPLLLSAGNVRSRLAFTVADYVDFYSSEQHATNVGRIFRPDAPALPAAWHHIPIAYHGRAGTVVVSGTDIVRPRGMRREATGEVVFAPTERLDLEAEVGFVVGTPSEQGQPTPMSAFADHVFGVVLLNDWSARDIQSFEYVPLGPFLGKSFATSVSAWVLPLEALEGARVRPPAREPRPLGPLDDTGAEPWGLDLALEVEVAGTVVSRPPFASTYWTPAQQLAHLTANGASLRTGDLYGSGTVSGPSDWGSLLELSWGGQRPIALADGSTRTFLSDGDEVVLRASARSISGARVTLGEVRGRVLSAAAGFAPAS